ncbi:hypothetical protein [Streptomyces sp. NPDC050759]|uniref:hypothetical protein n=1 Tax=Streptomyces sp. NPDC050759 TaxID=3365635 RepID=UPI0037A32ADF
MSSTAPLTSAGEPRRSPSPDQPTLEPFPAEHYFYLAAYSSPIAGIPLHSATGRLEWSNGEVMCAYEPLTARAVLGPETHWPHVFAVMKARANRFGDDGACLVVAFD